MIILNRKLLKNINYILSLLQSKKGKSRLKKFKTFSIEVDLKNNKSINNNEYCRFSSQRLEGQYQSLLE